MKPKVTVLCLAYNHANYIRQALDGFVMQKTNFPFEVVVHDDASTDGTADIIREYQEKYPNIIKPILQQENQYSQGKRVTVDYMFNEVRGEYVALNEGDDYWIDENKLQRQVEELDAHPESTICFHPVKVVWEDGSQCDDIYPLPSQRFNKTVLTFKDLLKCNFIQTNSVMYRWKLTKEMFPQSVVLPEDLLLHLLHAKYGNIRFIPQIMSVYRRNEGGIWTGCRKTDAWFLRCGIPNIRFYQTIEKLFNVDQSENITFIGKKVVELLLRNKDFATLQRMVEEFSEKWDLMVPSVTLNVRQQRRKERRLTRVLCLVIVLMLCFLGISLYLLCLI